MRLSEAPRRDYTINPTAKLGACLVCKFPLLISLLFFTSAYGQAPDGWSGPAQDLDTRRVRLDAASVKGEFNGYDQERVEPLYVQARQMQEIGSHTEAIALFKEAIHILRINQGLYADSQLELVEAMIESEISLQNWDVVNQHYGYMEHLVRRLYDVSDPRLESGLQKVVSWHVNALNVNIDGKRIEHLQQANKIFKLRLQIAQHNLSTDVAKLDFLHRNIEICERQLFLASELNKEMQRRQQRARQNSLLADLD